MNRDAQYDCLIIGAGQAGLATGRLAKSANLKFLILERAEAAGGEWAGRAPDHVLFTPRNLSQLTGLSLTEGPGDGYPTNAEMARYFARYADTQGLPVQTNADVVALTREEGSFVIALKNGNHLSARTVVLANGSNQVPAVPRNLSDPLAGILTQTTARNFWRNLPPPGAKVLVVGDGASGRQAALDLVRSNSEVTLAGTGRRLAPATFLGRSIMAWLITAGLMFSDRDTRMAKLLQRMNPVPSKQALGDVALKAAGVNILPRLIKTGVKANPDGSRSACAWFRDGRSMEPDHIVWCTGYKEQTDFIKLRPEIAEDWYTAGRGSTEVPGLFVVGRAWLRSRGSELILGAERDATHVMQHLKEHLRSD